MRCSEAPLCLPEVTKSPATGSSLAMGCHCLPGSAGITTPVADLQDWHLPARSAEPLAVPTPADDLGEAFALTA